MSGDLEEANAVLFRQFLEWKAKAESATTSTLSTTEDVAAKGETPASNVISKHDIGDSPSPSSVSSTEEHIVPTEPSSECVKSAAATKQVSKDPPTGPVHVWGHPYQFGTVVIEMLVKVDLMLSTTIYRLNLIQLCKTKRCYESPF